MGCGGDDDSRGVRVRGRNGNTHKSPKKKSRSSHDKSGSLSGIDQNKLPPKLRNIDWSSDPEVNLGTRNTRDPFRPYVEDLLVKTEDPTQQAQNPITQIKTAIGYATVEELSLIAIITGTAVHKAMVKDGRGLGHIVRAGDIVGQNPPMRVERITRNEVVFKALEVKEKEEKPTEIRKVLLTQEELQKLP
jgi:Tfp pilus assembly protein PilP